MDKVENGCCRTFFFVLDPLVGDATLHTSGTCVPPDLTHGVFIRPSHWRRKSATHETATASISNRQSDDFWWALAGAVRCGGSYFPALQSNWRVALIAREFGLYCTSDYLPRHGIDDSGVCGI